MVLIFSRPWRCARSSNALKTSSRTPTTRSGGVRSAKGVKSTTSANSTVTSSWASAMRPSWRFSRSAIDAGSTLRSSRSELASAASRARIEYWSSR